MATSGVNCPLPFPVPNFLASRAAIHPATTLQLDEISAVAQDDAVLLIRSNMFLVCPINVVCFGIFLRKPRPRLQPTQRQFPISRVTIGRPRLLSAKMCSRQLVRNVSQYKPGADLDRRPTTIISGSSTFTRNATLTPNASPAEVSISLASLSPFDAALKTSSQVPRHCSFLVAANRLAMAGPEANSSSTGCSFRPQ